MDTTNLKNLLTEISSPNPFGEEITLVGATKMVDAETINEAVKSGLKVVAENRVQEFREKTDKIVGATQHFIGHLQTNKVKYLIGKVDLIQSVDSFRLASTIDELSAKKGVTTNVLIEINVGGELSKSGFDLDNVYSAVKEISSLKNVKVLGLMAMLPKADENTLIPLCTKMREVYDTLKDEYGFKYLSMGMSGDYKIAIKCGSNMIRLGSHIFGKRNYEVKENGNI